LCTCKHLNFAVVQLKLKNQFYIKQRKTRTLQFVSRVFDEQNSKSTTRKGQFNPLKLEYVMYVWKFEGVKSRTYILVVFIARTSVPYKCIISTFLRQRSGGLFFRYIPRTSIVKHVTNICVVTSSKWFRKKKKKYINVHLCYRNGKNLTKQYSDDKFQVVPAQPRPRRENVASTESRVRPSVTL